MVIYQPGGPDGTVAHQAQIDNWTLCFTDKGIGNRIPYIHIYERVTMETIHHSRAWAHSLKAVYGTLQSCCNI